jgi:RNA polymerase sigma factor (sigma-70 family)
MRIFRNNNSNYSDDDLIKKYKESMDKNYVGELYKRHTGFVFAICFRYLKDKGKTEEITMEIFESLFDKLLEHEITNFKPWLHTLSRNHCLLYFRNLNYEKKKLGIKKENSEKNMDFDPFVHPDYEIKEEQFFLLQKFIEKLKDEQKICVELFYLEEKSYTEISEKTGFSFKEVKSYLQNGKRNLKLQFDKYNEQKQ